MNIACDARAFIYLLLIFRSNYAARYVDTNDANIRKGDNRKLIDGAHLAEVI